MIKKITSALAILLMSAIAVTAQDKKVAAVARAVEQLKEAMVSGDRQALENLAADQLSYGHSGGTIDTRTSFVEKIASGQSDFVSMDLSDQSIIVSGKTAIVRHILKAKTNDGGKPGDVHLRIMLVWQKQNGKWKLLGRQAVKVT